VITFHNDLHALQVIPSPRPGSTRPTCWP